MDHLHRDVGAGAVADGRDPAGDDVELLRRIGQGDEGAMAAFYRAHGRVVLAQILLVTEERVLAEEIVQDTMLAVWRGANSFRSDSSVRSWVIAIARRQTRDRLRGQRLRLVDNAFLADQPGSVPGPEVTALDRAELAEVKVAIRVVIKTASGQLVTVTTTATTRLSASGPLVSDITDGATVVVAGTSAGGGIAADYVIVGGNPTLSVPNVVTVRGTVSGASPAGFTVTTPGGTQVLVTTSATTVVTVSQASLGLSASVRLFRAFVPASGGSASPRSQRPGKHQATDGSLFLPRPARPYIDWSGPQISQGARARPSSACRRWRRYCH